MPRPPFRLGPAALVWLLGISQIIGYGTAYYSFAILAGDIAADLGRPVSWVYGAFSAALLVGGLAAPAVGRRIDRHGAGAVMAAGSALAGAALVATAAAPGPVAFVLGLAALQVAAPLILYDAAFAAVVQACGGAARRRITHLTLIAGFASTLFWPLTSWLHTVLDWRLVFVVFAGLNLAVCLPIHLAIARARRAAVLAAPADDPAAAPPAADGEPPLPDRLKARVFVLVTAGFALSGFLLSAILAQMVPVLGGLGLGEAALVVSTLFGPAQVLVRFVTMAVGPGRHPLTLTLFAAVLTPLAAAILAATAPAVAGAAVFAILLGFGSGLKSIVQGTLPLALFGSAAYGTRLGRMALARQFLAAAAPFALAATIETAGPIAALLLFAAIGCLGLACFVEVARLRRAAAAD